MMIRNFAICSPADRVVEFRTVLYEFQFELPEEKHHFFAVFFFFFSGVFPLECAFARVYICSVPKVLWE